MDELDYRWGEKPIQSFAMNSIIYKEECAEYDRLRPDIISQCKKLSGNWSINCYLRGKTIEEAKPTVMIIYTTEPPVDWDRPYTGTLALELIEGEFWGIGGC
jgi:hypothetical protein